jgi:hypothetical protein
MFTEESQPKDSATEVGLSVPTFSTYEIRVLEGILDYMEEHYTTPSLSQLAEIVYGDPEKKTAVYYHVEALREAGALSTNPALRGRIALVNPEEIKRQIEHDRAIYAAKAEAELEKKERRKRSE